MESEEIPKQTRADGQSNTDVQKEQVPLLRVSLFQGCHLEWLVPSAGETDAWLSRTAARSLFKLLLCAPNRQLIRSQLAGLLWPETDEERARESLRSAIKVLRSVLRPAQGENLLQSLPGEVLKLKGQEDLWVDADAFESLVQQASHSRDPDEALALWEQARGLVQGEFLGEELSSEWVHCRWVKIRRQTLRAARRRMIRSLADLYIQSGQEQRAEEILYEHVIRFPTDQDAQYRLMKILIKAECFEEARASYEQYKATLATLGKQPADHLKALEAHVIARSRDMPKEWQTQRFQLNDGKEAQYITLPSTIIQSRNNQYIQAREALTPGPDSEASTKSILVLPAPIASSELSSEPVIPPDCATWFGLKIAKIVTLVQQWYGMATFCHEMQHRVDQEIKTLDTLKLHYPSNEYALSRRTFLVALAALPTTLLSSLKQGNKLTLILEELLPQCAASLTACWHLSGGSHLEVIGPILDSYLPVLVSITKQTTVYQEITAALVAQIYSLKAILAWHLTSLDDAEAFCIQALHYSDHAKSSNLRLTALNQHALISYYGQHFEQALAKSEEAAATLKKISGEHIFPIVQGRVFMYLAAIQAQQNVKRAEQTLENAHNAFALQGSSIDPVPLYADCGNAPLMLWDGLTHYYLGRHDVTHSRKALTSLQIFGQLQSDAALPERFRLECLNSRTLAAIQLKEMEEAIACMNAGKQGARALESKQRRREVSTAYAKMSIQWPREVMIQTLNNDDESDHHILGS
jgi:DNA-binding SARP family transcriptional activator